jgi:hypothetical protein
LKLLADALSQPNNNMIVLFSIGFSFGTNIGFSNTNIWVINKEKASN